MERAEHLICSVIRGQAEGWPASGDADAVPRFIDLLRYHGLSALFDRALSGSAARESWPAAILEHCRDATLAQAVSVMASRTQLARVLQAFANCGIKALLLKGVPLSYSHYDSPVLRPRGDTDVLVPQSCRVRAEEILGRLGYVRFPGVTGDYICYQSTWSLEDGIGLVHDVDLHWRVNNSQVLAKLLDYDELEARATELPGLCAHAHALAPVHALLFACMHRSGHGNTPYYVNGTAYLGGGRLIWLYDVHLLVTRMSAGELAEFAVLAARKRMKSICREGLAGSIECFHTPVPESVMEALAPSGPMEPSARYCKGGRTSQMVDEFFALDNMNARARWLGEMAFPPAEYMRGKYTGAAVSWLPLLYVRRAVHGLWQLVLSRRSEHSH